MKVDRLLSSLRKVKQTGRGEWVACCSAHEDRSPSLAIKEADDGRVLIHCFAGCSPLEVLNAVGMTFEDIMPERVGPIDKVYHREKFQAKTVLEALTTNSLLLAVMSNEVANGHPITKDDAVKFAEISEELREAADYAC